MKCPYTKICCLLFTSSLLGCGYQLKDCQNSWSHNSLSVPFIKGDRDGALTQEVVDLLTEEGRYNYTPCGGILELHARVVDEILDNVGFSYDLEQVNNKPEPTKVIIPTETRLTITIEVSIINKQSGCTIIPNFTLTDSIVFDHDYYTIRNNVNTFSLGQLTEFEEAQSAAFRPLYHKIAKKISDYLKQQ